MTVWDNQLLYCRSSFENNIPHILQSQTLSSFRRHLKTHYFQPSLPHSPIPNAPWLFLWDFGLYKSLPYLLIYLHVLTKSCLFDAVWRKLQSCRKCLLAKSYNQWVQTAESVWRCMMWMHKCIKNLCRKSVLRFLTKW